MRSGDHPALVDKPELVDEVMDFYKAYPELVDPELNETHEGYLARLDRLGFEIRPDGRLAPKPDRRVVNL